MPGRVEGANVARRGGDGGRQVDDTVHQHQGEEADLEGEGMHDKPVFGGLQQPDDDRVRKIIRIIARRAQRGQPAQEAIGEPEDFLRVRSGEQPAGRYRRPAAKLRSGNMAATRKTASAPRKTPVPINARVRISADEAGTGGQAGQLGQVDKDKAQHDHPVEDALDDDRRQRGRDGRCLRPS